MLMNQIKSILSFMQHNDKNGSWFEWYNEIQRNESEFDIQYTLNTLKAWYNDTGDNSYINMITYINSIQTV
ncbi:hypothetical protein D3C78_1511800 [compost metagenome]